MRALYIIVPVLCILVDRLPLLQRVHRGEGHGRWTTRGRRRRIPNPTAHNYYPDQQMGAVRPPLRGDRRRGSADRSGARGAVRLRARAHLAGRRRLPRRRRPRLRSRCGRRRGAAARRSPTSRAPRSARSPASTAAHRDPLHPRHRAGRPRPRRRQRAGRQRLGHVHDRHDDSAGAA